MSVVHLVSSHCVPITRKRNATQRHMALTAVEGALAEFSGVRPDALFVGNMLGAHLHNQQQLGALVADDAGLAGIEAMTIETACSSGAAALRVGWMAIAGGVHDLVVVVGVEAMSRHDTPKVTHGLAMASDWDAEGRHGATFVSLNAALMRAYMASFPIGDEAFAPFALLAHKNALTAPHAGLKKPIGLEDYVASRPIDAPLRLLDASLICDGAAAVVLASDRGLARLEKARNEVLRVDACEVATDTVALSRRSRLLELRAVGQSVDRALTRAGKSRSDIDLFEVHDAYTIMAAASLEASGFVEEGRAPHEAADGAFALDGRLPIATFGGLKARGHAIGATGVYQVAEARLQLLELAGKNQVPHARCALTQSIGGAGSTVIATVITRPDT